MVVQDLFKVIALYESRNFMNVNVFLLVVLAMVSWKAWSSTSPKELVFCTCASRACFSSFSLKNRKTSRAMRASNLDVVAIAIAILVVRFLQTIILVINK